MHYFVKDNAKYFFQGDRAGGSWTENFGAVRSTPLAPFRAERRMQLYETREEKPIVTFRV